MLLVAAIGFNVETRSALQQHEVSSLGSFLYRNSPEHVLLSCILNLGVVVVPCCLCSRL
jgi:hypothetical protein